MLSHFPTKMQLHPDEIHLWICKPEGCHSKELLNRYNALLTLEEKQKQQKFLFEKDRHSALVTRAFVRDLLSHYADVQASEWRFKKGEYGKPEIINPPIPLRFNLSHCKDMIVCAVTLNHDIGCDVESANRSNNALSIARHYFSENEIEALFNLSEEQQMSRFFEYWTLKESYIKACGQGLLIPLSDFSFQIGKAGVAANMLSESEPGPESEHESEAEETDLATETIAETRIAINSNIQLNFAANRNDASVNWSSWLMYPSKEHCMAVSVKNSDLRASDYQLRFFESIPLSSVKEVFC